MSSFIQNMQNITSSDISWQLSDFGLLGSDINSDKNSDQGNSIVNRYVYNRDLNKLVDRVERSLFGSLFHR